LLKLGRPRKNVKQAAKLVVKDKPISVVQEEAIPVEEDKVKLIVEDNAIPVVQCDLLVPVEEDKAAVQAVANIELKIIPCSKVYITKYCVRIGIEYLFKLNFHFRFLQTN